ncbi:MAG: hypothetical protein WAP52_04160 [Candidatus Sungiibacteriota bacterium]
MGDILFGTGFAIDFVVRKITNPIYRVITITAIAIALLLAGWRQEREAMR